MKIIEKLKSARGFLTRSFEKKTKNIRWEVRYKNLEKKYQAEKEEYENTIRGFEDKLNKDKNLSMIEYLKKQVKRKNNIIENLKNDLEVFQDKNKKR